MVGGRTHTLLKHQILLRLRLVDGDKAMLLFRLMVAKVKARAVKARARLRILLLVALLLLLLVAMLLLLMVLVGEADLDIMSVLIVGRKVTTRIRALNWPP